MAYRIKESDCIKCGSCEATCPASCISEKDDGVRVINENDCISCGSCAGVCPVQCISEVQ